MKERYLKALKEWHGYQEESNGNTCFGKLYAIRHNEKAFENAEWCMMYLSETARLCNIPTDIIPDTASCPTFYDRMKQYQVPVNEAIPGDIVVFMWKTNTDGKPDHVGIIEEVYPINFRIREGNHSVPGIARHCVYNNRILSKDDKEIYAIIRPPYLHNSDEQIRETYNKLMILLKG